MGYLVAWVDKAKGRAGINGVRIPKTAESFKLN